MLYGLMMTNYALYSCFLRLYDNFMSECRLTKMFELREKFMRDLAAARPAVLQNWPVDIKSKEGQQAVRDNVLKGVEEMFESLQHLKNWKPHRASEVKDFDQDAFLEEFVDAFNFFLAVPIMLGISSDELFDAYLKKDIIINDRIKKGY